MASLCILHNDPAGVRDAFSVVATPQLDPSDLASAKRAKIDAEQLSAIFQDFSGGLGVRTSQDPPLLKKPIVIDTTAA